MEREVGEGYRRDEKHVCPWRIHVDLWQKPSQYFKVIILQLKKKKKSYMNVSLPFNLAISLLGCILRIYFYVKSYLYNTADISISGKLGIVQKPPMRKCLNSIIIECCH